MNKIVSKTDTPRIYALKEKNPRIHMPKLHLPKGRFFQKESSAREPEQKEPFQERSPKREHSEMFFTYVKVVLTIVLAVFIVADLLQDQVSSAGIEEVAAATAEAAGFSDTAQAEARMVKRFYGLNPNDYEGAVLYAPKDNMDVQELFIVKLRDSSQKKEVEEAIKKRLDTQQKSFEGYGAEQTALLEKHVLEMRSNFILYCVGENAQAAQAAFIKSL